MQIYFTTIFAVLISSSFAFAGGAEKLVHDLSTSLYEISAEGNNCELLLQYNSHTAAGDFNAPIYINATLADLHAEIYSNVDIKSVATNGNVLVLDQKFNALKKSHIVIYIDQFGKPLKAEGYAHKYFQSAKISCVFK